MKIIRWSTNKIDIKTKEKRKKLYIDSVAYTVHLFYSAVVYLCFFYIPKKCVLLTLLFWVAFPLILIGVIYIYMLFCH